MNARSACVVEIKGHSLDDGPGIRSVIFLKGCPLACSWCHNPESIDVDPVLSFDADDCDALGDCLRACPRGAIDLTAAARIDRDTCNDCGDCAAACATGALSVTGRHMSVGEIVAAVSPYFPFHRDSGGGITLSGGEPTLQGPVASELLQAFRAAGAHTLVETCGHFHTERFFRTIAPHTDTLYFDLKLANPDAHRRHCGRDNRLILENFRRLAARAENRCPEVHFRIPLVPGITATDENLAALAHLLREAGVRDVTLLPYNPTWTRKAARVGRAASLDAGWMSEAELARCRGHFAGVALSG